MNEYVVLAQKWANPSDPESDIAEWKVGTFEQIAYWLEKWEDEGYLCNVRRCTNPLNNEFVKARIEKVVQA
jgi:hypothetical protein